MATLLLLVTLVCGTSAVSIMPELKHNILKIINILSNTLKDRKGKSPTVGFKPNASHLLDECPNC